MTIRFGIYRVLGNDMPPRHAADQTARNTDFILENEKKFEGTERFWCLNRIYDKAKVDALKYRLDAAEEEWFEIPFDLAEYKSHDSARDRLHYATNVNAARNKCLGNGLPNYDVTVILDGAAFMTRAGWYAFEEMVYVYRPENEGAYAFPVARVQTFDEFQQDEFMPQIKEQIQIEDRKVYGMREPYLAFTPQIDIRFNENLIYGKVDKVELMWRLGMRGPWDWWEPAIREEACKTENLSKFAGSVKMQGYAIRLPNHTSDDCLDARARGHTRLKGTNNLIRLLDALGT